MPVVGGTGGCKPGREWVDGGHVILVAEMMASAVGGTGGSKPGREQVGSAPLTSVKGLFRNPDFTW